jgi:hypothetical protein
MSRSSRNLWPIAVACAGIIVVLLLLQLREPSQLAVRDAADSTAYELERTPVRGLGITVFDVEEALDAGTRGTGSRYGGSIASRLRVRSAGEDSRGDLYEITTSRGHHPVCLAVKVDIDLTDRTPSFPITDVTDGRCHPA